MDMAFLFNDFKVYLIIMLLCNASNHFLDFSPTLGKGHFESSLSAVKAERPAANENEKNTQANDHRSYDDGKGNPSRVSPDRHAL